MWRLKLQSKHSAVLAAVVSCIAIAMTTGSSVAANDAESRSDGFRLTSWPEQAGTPRFRLLDSDGHTRTLAAYRGRLVVMFFGFVRCPDVCPAELFKLSTVMKQLGPLNRRIQVLFVTLDPSRDTRKVLKSYVNQFDPRFIGLTGSSNEIDRAAASFHVEYARVAQGSDYTIDHSATTFVFDSSGRLRLMGSMTTSVGDYAHDLTELAAERSDSVIR